LLTKVINFYSAILRAPDHRELVKFLEDVKIDRRKQLQYSKTKVGLIYYIWIDEQAGQLRFSFINSNHTTLPFSNRLTFAANEKKSWETI